MMFVLLGNGGDMISYYNTLETKLKTKTSFPSTGFFVLSMFPHLQTQKCLLVSNVLILRFLQRRNNWIENTYYQNYVLNCPILSGISSSFTPSTDVSGVLYLEITILSEIKNSTSTTSSLHEQVGSIICRNIYANPSCNKPTNVRR